MAEEVEQAQDEKPSGKKVNRGRLMIGGVFLAVMAAEAVVVFILVKAFVAPPPQVVEASAVTEGLDAEEGEVADSVAEVKVAQFRAQNEKSQRVLIYDLTIYAVVPKSKEEDFIKLMEERGETIKDRFTRIVRAADPARFLEPDLATLRELFKHELARLAASDDEGKVVQEVLIPSIVSYSEG